MKLIYSSFQYNHQNYETNHAVIQNIILLMTGMQKGGRVSRSNPINTESERGIESVSINGVSVLSMANLEKKKCGLFFPSKLTAVPSNPK